jgi:hypothetical protein
MKTFECEKCGKSSPIDHLVSNYCPHCGDVIHDEKVKVPEGQICKWEDKETEIPPGKKLCKKCNQCYENFFVDCPKCVLVKKSSGPEIKFDENIISLDKDVVSGEEKARTIKAFKIISIPFILFTLLYIILPNSGIAGVILVYTVIISSIFCLLLLIFMALD